MPLIHSAGAGLSLAAAGTTVLLAASTMVAFNGFPGMEETAAPAPVRLAVAPPPLRGNAEGARRPVRLRAVPGSRSPSRTRGRSRVAERTSAVVPARGEVLGISEDAPPKRRARTRSAPTAAPVATPAPANAPPAKTPVEQLQQTVDDVVEPVDQALDPVRTMVGGAGQVVGGLVQGLRPR